MKKTLLFFVLFLTYAVSTKASTGKYRLTLRDNPATSIVIGWNQINGNNPVVYYGTTDYGKIGLAILIRRIHLGLLILLE